MVNNIYVYFLDEIDVDPVLNSSEWPPQFYKAFSIGASACLPLLAIMNHHRLALVAPCSFPTFKSHVIVYAIRAVQQLNLTDGPNQCRTARA